MDVYYFAERTEAEAIDFIQSEGKRLKYLKDKAYREARKEAQYLQSEINDSFLRQKKLEDEFLELKDSFDATKKKVKFYQRNRAILHWVIHAIWTIGAALSVLSIGGLPEEAKNYLLQLSNVIPSSIKLDAGINNFEASAIIYAVIYLVVSSLSDSIKYKFSKFLTLAWLLLVVQYESQSLETYISHLLISEGSTMLFIVVSFVVEFFVLVNRKL